MSLKHDLSNPSSPERQHKRIKPEMKVKIPDLEDAGMIQDEVLDGSLVPKSGKRENKKVSERTGPDGTLQRNEVILLLQETLEKLGFEELSESLAVASGVRHRMSEIKALKECILTGDLKTGMRKFEELAGNIAQPQTIAKVKCMIAEEQYLEALCHCREDEALAHLQQDLPAYGADLETRNVLAGCMLLSSELAIMQQIGWVGIRGKANRKRLISGMRDLLPPTLWMQENRLPGLLAQAISPPIFPQIQSKLPDSLRGDGRLAQRYVPVCTQQVLDLHKSEVWHVQFSHCGKSLCTATKDGTCSLYELNDVDSCVFIAILLTEQTPIHGCWWSPNDKYVACLSGHHCSIINVEDRLQAFRIAHHDSVTSMAWLGDGSLIATSGENKTVWITDLKGERLHASGETMDDMMVWHDGTLFCTPSGQRRVARWRATMSHGYSSNACATILEEDENIVSFCASADYKMILINSSDRSLHLWRIPEDLEDSDSTAYLMHTLQGPQSNSSMYFVMSCFGGPNELFVASGSEDCKVLIWHTLTGELLASLDGHSGTVNAVAWNAQRPHILASASDDGTVHIWRQDALGQHFPRQPSRASCLADTPLSAHVYGQSFFKGEFEHATTRRHRLAQLQHQRTS